MVADAWPSPEPAERTERTESLKLLCPPAILEVTLQADLEVALEVLKLSLSYYV